ncbi:UNVERIFIED_CONTAM: hypothetical protein FKN15_010492 [Acipenser sinensis]
MKPKGKCVMLCEYKNKYHELEFQILEEKVQPVLGLKTCAQMGLIQRVEEIKHLNSQELQELYAEVFHGLGCLEGQQHIRVKQNARCVVHAPRKIPVICSVDLQVALEKRKIHSVGTVQSNRLGGCPFMSDSEMKKKGRRTF